MGERVRGRKGDGEKGDEKVRGAFNDTIRHSLIAVVL
jgi:hypothetical protein